MRVLLDECVPRPLRRELRAHTVRTVAELGWAGKQNGELLALIVQTGFDVFITVDQNLRYQQNLRTAGIVVLVLVAPSNRLVALLPLMEAVRTIVETVKPGDVVEISAQS